MAGYSQMTTTVVAEESSSGIPEPKTYEIAWTVPSNGEPLPTMHVLIGDTVIFNYGEDQPHDVFIHPNKMCEMPVDRIRVKGNAGPGVFTFTETGQHYFVCETGGHCEMGLYIRIFAYELECERLVAYGSIESCDDYIAEIEDGNTDSDGDGTSNGNGGNGEDKDPENKDKSSGFRTMAEITVGGITAVMATLW